MDSLGGIGLALGLRARALRFGAVAFTGAGFLRAAALRAAFFFGRAAALAFFRAGLARERDFDLDLLLRVALRGALLRADFFLRAAVLRLPPAFRPVLRAVFRAFFFAMGHLGLTATGRTS
jgi:hypothetical protein